MRLIPLFALLLLCTFALRAEEQRVAAVDVKPEKPRVEVVFVLDTTGSMGGLIQAAKTKIWSIANTLATAKPSPDIKMGLVGYRDRGDAYITKVTDLSRDLDAVYRELMGFQAAGGGDEPESVNQALNDAITRIAWSKDSKVYRVIFLVGDAPPHMDYADDVKYPETCKLAATAGIIINTIQCGSAVSTQTVWKDIAAKAEGHFFQVEQEGSAVMVSTPYDAKLAALAQDLDGTRISYGSADEKKAQAMREDGAKVIYKSAPASAQASRAAFQGSAAGEQNFAGTKELVKDVSANGVKLDALKAEELPAEMQKLDPEDRAKYVEEKKAKREAIQKEIVEVNAKRQQFLAEEAKKQEGKGKSTLEKNVTDTINKQGEKLGIKCETSF